MNSYGQASCGTIVALFSQLYSKFKTKPTLLSCNSKLQNKYLNTSI